MNILEDKGLQFWCDYWAERLGLMAWEITAKYVKVEEQNGHEGLTNIKLNVERAFVNITHPDHMPDTRDKDVEVTLVHELLHVRMWGFDRTPDHDCPVLEYRLTEQAIEWIARALVGQRREK